MPVLAQATEEAGKYYCLKGDAGHSEPFVFPVIQMTKTVLNFEF